MLFCPVSYDTSLPAHSFHMPSLNPLTASKAAGTLLPIVQQSGETQPQLGALIASFEAAWSVFGLQSCCTGSSGTVPVTELHSNCI